MRVSNLINFAVELDHSASAGRQGNSTAGTYNNSTAILAEIFDFVNAAAQPLRDIVSISFNISFQP